MENVSSSCAYFTLVNTCVLSCSSHKCQPDFDSGIPSPQLGVLTGFWFIAKKTTNNI